MPKLSSTHYCIIYPDKGCEQMGIWPWNGLHLMLGASTASNWGFAPCYFTEKNR